MRLVSTVVLMLFILGCSQTDAPEGTDSASQQDSSGTLTNLVHVDGLSEGYQHPLVCGPGGDFPEGQELIFRDTVSNNFIHAVFPEGIETPDEIQGISVLHGHFQGIQNRTRYTRKTPPEDYSYFVVSSWE